MSKTKEDNIMISIHALREEGDQRHPEREKPFHYFNPRPPRGGRPLTEAQAEKWLEKFQSTPSARRATDAAQHRGTEGIISIHALREEGDQRHLRKFSKT